MKLRRVRSDMNLKGKRVLVRIDANVPLKNGRVVDGIHGRIARSAVGLDWFVQRGAKVIVMAHLGRPGGRRVAAYSLKPVAKRLSELLRTKVRLARTVIGEDVKKSVAKMKDGEVLLLENIRFDRREEDNAPSLATALGSIADIYVNDAFSVSHRAHTSLDAITSELPAYAGPLLANEVATLSKLDNNVKHPFVLVMGGLKMNTKLPVIKRFAKEVDHVLIGGALAATFFAAQGMEVGKSVFDDTAVEIAGKELALMRNKFVLPIDVVVASSMRKDARHRVCLATEITKKDRIVDIGPETIKRYQEVIGLAKTIVWNGPLGYCEVSAFCTGTREIAKAIADRTGKAMSIVGGGDTVPVLESLGVADKFSLLSTGGGAMLDFLGGKPLPGVEALRI